MRTVSRFERSVKEIENLWIPLTDGSRLAARGWLPEDAEARPVPAILEYLPYRKRDGTAERDELTHPYFAGHGYAGVRVDMRGNGESDGLMADEYTRQEQDDALEVIDWLTEQPWCDGTVGMMGISWGGFNSLQVAARQPAALKAVITLCSTDDRYADDIHYKGGALLNENLGWASTMLAFSSRPPDPLLAGDRWRELWMQRLQHMPLLVETWLRHPHRNDYWKQGSVCENFAAIKAAVYAIGGWGDAYSNAVPRLLAGLTAPAKGLIGPWVHKYPHFAVPEPAIGFLQEALRWWDYWLKGEDTGIMDEPKYRVYMMESVRPQTAYAERAGRWIAEQDWPAKHIATQCYWLNSDGLSSVAETPRPVSICSPQNTGVAAGEYCAIWLGPEWPGDQRLDDGGSLVFDTEPLSRRLEIFGAPAITVQLSSDRPQALLVARLCDVWPDGASTRVSYGVLNLCHRESHQQPTLLNVGQTYTVRLQLDDIAYAFPAGHRIRLALSTVYWPLCWTSPEAATITLRTGISQLDLPERSPHASDDALAPFESPECAPPMTTQVIRPGNHRRSVEHELNSGETTTRIVDDFGRYRIDAHGLDIETIARELYRVHPDQPLSATAETHWTLLLERGDWRVRTESRTRMSSDRENFYVHADLDAFEGDRRVFAHSWDRSIPRDQV